MIFIVTAQYDNVYDPDTRNDDCVLISAASQREALAIYFDSWREEARVRYISVEQATGTDGVAEVAREEQPVMELDERVEPVGHRDWTWTLPAAEVTLEEPEEGEDA